MHIRLFSKRYWLRRFSGQNEIDGYLVSGYNDYVVSLNVHPMGSDTLQALPEGERYTKHLEGHGDAALVVADSQTGSKGDLLYYQGNWYECTACQLWDHTPLAHYNYQFALVPKNGTDYPDISNAPEGDPEVQGGGIQL